MQQLGWVEGRNLRVDIRWAPGNTDDTRKYDAPAMAPTNAHFRNATRLAD